jgi:hypothetical protein
MAGILTVDTIQSDSSYASRINVTSNVAFTSPVNFTGGMQIGGQDTTFGGMRNRIINGAMTIDQRAAGANTTITTSGIFSVDRWSSATNVSSKFKVGQNLNSISAPNGFYNYLGVQSLSAYSVGSSEYSALYHSIESYNLLDLNLGSSSGSPFTISFWVRSSLTGTFTFAASASYGSNATYATTYTINSANTWEYKTITIPATSIGSWNRANDLGMMLWWDLGTGSTYQGTANTWSSSYTLKVSGTQNVIGTNGATFYITGVQLEKGSAATAFENRQFGTELALCQRYFQLATRGSQGANYSADTGVMPFYFPVQMRTNPSAGFLTGSTASIDIIGGTQSGGVGASGANGSPLCFNASITGLSGRTAGIPIMYVGSNLFFSAEL